MRYCGDLNKEAGLILAILLPGEDFCLQCIDCYRADLLVADNPILVDHVSLRNAVNAIIYSCPAFGIDNADRVRVSELLQPSSTHRHAGPCN